MSQTPVKCRTVGSFEKSSTVGAEICSWQKAVRRRVPASHVDSNIGPESRVYIDGEFPALISVELVLEDSTSLRRTYRPVSTIVQRNKKRHALESVLSPYDPGLNTTEAFRVLSDVSTGSSQRAVYATDEPDCTRFDSNLLGYREGSLGLSRFAISVALRNFCFMLSRMKE